MWIFNIVNQVMLLTPDPEDNLFARWTGPEEFDKHHSLHSHVVKFLDEGTTREHFSRALCIVKL